MALFPVFDEALLLTQWQVYLRQLQSNPLRTKMLTSGVLSALQELLASWIAHDVSKHGHYFSARVPKMALYGMFVSAPLGHLLIGILQKIFAGRTSTKAKIMQIIVSNLIVRASLPAACRLDPAVREQQLLTGCITTGLPDSKHGLSVLHGRDCGRPDFPPGPRDRQGRFHASNEGQLDHLALGARLCAEIPAGTCVGAVLQPHRLHHRHICQHAHQEEASRGSEKGMSPTANAR